MVVDSSFPAGGCGCPLTTSTPTGLAQAGTSDISSMFPSVSPMIDEVKGLTEGGSGIWLINLANRSRAGLFSGSRRRTRRRQATWRFGSVTVKLNNHHARAEAGLSWMKSTNNNRASCCLPAFKSCSMRSKILAGGWVIGSPQFKRKPRETHRTNGFPPRLSS